MDSYRSLASWPLTIRSCPSASISRLVFWKALVHAFVRIENAFPSPAFHSRTFQRILAGITFLRKTPLQTSVTPIRAPQWRPPALATFALPARPARAAVWLRGWFWKRGVTGNNAETHCAIGHLNFPMKNSAWGKSWAWIWERNSGPGSCMRHVISGVRWP